MCLAVPHTIETILGEHRALAAAGAVRTEIRTDLVVMSSRAIRCSSTRDSP